MVKNSQAATINAASCSYSDVAAAVAAASAGDTVSVPPGSCTWASTLAITKGIKLIGPGSGNLKITNGVSGVFFMITYDPSSYDLNSEFEITGFRFDSNSKMMLSLGGGITAPFTAQTKIKIHDNFFENTGATNIVGQAIWSYGSLYGVIYNNTFDHFGYPMKFQGNINGDSWWQYNDFSLGSDKYMYVEDNVFSNMQPLGGGDDIITDGYVSCRYVYRYNTIETPSANSYSLFDIHGEQWGGNAACFGAELYGNNVSAGDKNITFLKQRSGQTRMFFNNVTSTYSGSWDPYSSAYTSGACICPTSYAAVKVTHNSYWWGNRQDISGELWWYAATGGLTCNGRSDIPALGIDVFTDRGSTPGITCGTSLSGGCSVGAGHWKPIDAQAGICNNLTGYVGVNAIKIQGTFYKCTSTNVWTPDYTPYTYPHPLRSETPQTCTYTYSAWGTCQSDNTQTRTVISSSPSGCTGTPILTQSCVYNPTYFLPEQYIEAESGTLSPPMQIEPDSLASGGSYVSTPTSNSGSISFTFSVSQAGQYMMQAKVNSNNDSGRNSFYVGLDSESAQGNNSYTYALPLVSSFTWDDVNKVGNGTTLPEFDPMTWNLTAGLHTFTFYGREANAWLDQIILKRVTDITPPAAPGGVTVR